MLSMLSDVDLSEDVAIALQESIGSVIFIAAKQDIEILVGEISAALAETLLLGERDPDRLAEWVIIKHLKPALH